MTAIFPHVPKVSAALTTSAAALAPQTVRAHNLVAQTLSFHNHWARACFNNFFANIFINWINFLNHFIAWTANLASLNAI